MNNSYICRRIDMSEYEEIRDLFSGVFTIEPWCDDWSDEEQLKCYLYDLTGQDNSLSYGLYEKEELIGVSLGRIKHWHSGTEYCIDEFCVRTDKQGCGCGTFFISEIKRLIREIGLTKIYLQTDENTPAYEFYKKNNFYELEHQVSFGIKV